MYQKIFKNIDRYLFYISIIIIFYIYLQFYLKSFEVNYLNNYAYSELFLNYEGGFVRRGLIGQIFLILNNNFAIKPELFFPILMVTAHSIFFSLYILLLKNFKNHLIFLPVLFSPALILFPIYDFSMFFIKDVFVKISFLTHAIIFLKFRNEANLYEKKLKLIILPLISFITVFIHEYQLLFFSVHLLFSSIILPYRKLKIYFWYFIIILAVVLVFNGNKEIAEQINNSISQFNIEVHPQLSGNIYWYVGGWYRWHFFYFGYKDFLMLLLSGILSIWFFFYIFQNLINKNILELENNFKKKYLLFFIPALGCFIATDHGRNLSLLANHLVIFYLSLRLNNLKFKSYIKEIRNNFTVINFIYLFLFFYIFMWYLPQDAGFGGAEQTNTIFKGYLFPQFKNFIALLYTFIDQNIFDLPDL